MQSLQPQLRQAFESPQKSEEKKIATVAGQGFCTCDKHICDFCMSGETDQSAQVRSTGVTEQEPPLARLQCKCDELCALTASEIDRRPELVSQFFADTAHPMEVKLRACEACSMTDSDGESEGISDAESVHSDDFSGAPDQLCGGWGFSRGHASGSSMEATSEDLDDALGLAKPEMSPDASSCQVPWRPARKIAGVRKSLRENSKGTSVSSDFLNDART
jgi:hypothetical protein